jgi:hypothetical protein
LNAGDLLVVLGVGGAIGAFAAVASASTRLVGAVERFGLVLREVAAEPRLREAYEEVERSAGGLLLALAALRRGLSRRGR